MVQQQVGFQEHLKAIANAEDQLLIVAKLAERLGHMMQHGVAQYAACGNVIAIAKTAGYAENLILVDQLRLLEQSIDMYPIGRSSGLLEGEGGLLVTVSARCPQDDNAWCHGISDLGISDFGFTEAM
jgi:hypothetical protein